MHSNRPHTRTSRTNTETRRLRYKFMSEQLLLRYVNYRSPHIFTNTHSFFTFLNAFKPSTHTYVSDKHRDARASIQIYEWATTAQVCQLQITSYLHHYSLLLHVLRCVQTVHTHVRLGRTQRRHGFDINLWVSNYCSGMSTTDHLISSPILSRSSRS